MGFFNNLLSNLSKNTARQTCKTMINSYNKFKQHYPNLSKREIYTLTLSSRPTWKRENPSSFVFISGRKKLTIKKEDTFRDVVRNLIILETAPTGLSHNIELSVNYFKNLSEVLMEEFKDFKE